MRATVTAVWQAPTQFVRPKDRCIREPVVIIIIIIIAVHPSLCPGGPGFGIDAIVHVIGTKTRHS